MRVKRAKISNWKSFGYTETPKWINFEGLNIIIGPNSHGKTNFANILRLVLIERPDFGSAKRGIEIYDCNEPDKQITINIDVELNDESKPYKLHHNCSYQELGQKLKNKDLSHAPIRNGFFPIGINRSMPKYGNHIAFGFKSHNWELVQKNWVEIKNDMSVYFDINLKNTKPTKQENYLSDIMDYNGVPRNETGSGIMAVLYFIMEMKVRVECKVFLFEEPENHMHPSLLRKFLEYLVILTKKRGMQFFITTHSSILIDNSILKETDSAIFHVKKENSRSNIINVSNNKKGLKDVLYNQLGYKPSDILLANTIIWVEGPSDRIYLKKWIQEKAPKLNEGEDFTIMFYGGSLLSHLTLDSDVDKFIKLGTISVNSAIIMDSDLKNEDENFDKNKKNKTKIRVRDSFRILDEFVWITEGREIENYIDKEILEVAVKEAHSKNTKFQINPNRYDQRIKITGSNTFNKVKTAEKVVNFQNENGISTDFDFLNLGDEVDALVKWIMEKNKKPVTKDKEH